MIATTDLATVALRGPVLLTIGTFDGVHRGHRFLLEQAASRALERSYHLVIVTFDPCPAVVLKPDIGRYQLTTATQKLELLSAVNPALVVMLPFSRELAGLTADQFLDAMEGHLELRELWMGEDFHFGRGREGGLELVVRRGGRDGFSVHVIARQNAEQATISSSRVRDLLARGDVSGVIPLLGRPFALQVAQQSTRFLDTTTLEVLVESHLAIPASGKYAVLLRDDDSQPDAACAVIEDSAMPIKILANRRPSHPVALEFVAPLNAQPGTGERAAARQQLAGWRHPHFPPAGSY